MDNFKWQYLYNPKKWWSFINGMIFQKIFGVRVPQKDTISWCEQIVYRSIVCSDCLKKGSCVDCGCKMPEAMTDPTNYCSAERWDEIDHERWAQFKKESGFNFKISYK